MKFGFNKGGLTVNSKPFNPLNLSVNEKGIESDALPEQKDPFEMLSALASLKGSTAEMTQQDKVRCLQSLTKNK